MALWMPVAAPLCPRRFTAHKVVHSRRGTPPSARLAGATRRCRRATAYVHDGPNGSSSAVVARGMAPAGSSTGRADWRQTPACPAVAWSVTGGKAWSVAGVSSAAGFTVGRVNIVTPHVPLQPLRQRYEVRVAIWVLQIGRLPVSTIEHEFGAAHACRCGGRVVVHDRDQRLQRIPVIPPRRLGEGRLQLSARRRGIAFRDDTFVQGIKREPLSIG
jgi:hypothetical protein